MGIKHTTPKVDGEYGYAAEWMQDHAIEDGTIQPEHLDPTKDFQASILDIDLLLRTLLNTPIARCGIDSANRLRIIIDAAGAATPVTISSGTVTTVSTLSAITTFPYPQQWELVDRSTIAYAEGQRSRMTFS